MAAEENGTEVQAITEEPVIEATEPTAVNEPAPADITETEPTEPEALVAEEPTEELVESEVPTETVTEPETSVSDETETPVTPTAPQTPAEPEESGKTTESPIPVGDEGALDGTGQTDISDKTPEQELTEGGMLEEEVPVEEVVDYNAMSVEELYETLSSLKDDGKYDSIIASLNEELRTQFIEYTKKKAEGELITVMPPGGVNFAEAAPLVKQETAVPTTFRALRAAKLQNGFDDTNTEVQDGLSMSKELVEYDAEKGKGLLELETFVTGKVTTETTTKPLDIVLVLDQSGSMSKSFGTMTGYNVFEGKNIDAKTHADEENLYYLENGQYYKVQVEITSSSQRYEEITGREKPYYSQINRGNYYYKVGEKYYRIQTEWISTSLLGGYYNSYYINDSGDKVIIEKEKSQYDRFGKDVYERIIENVYTYSYTNEGAQISLGESKGNNGAPPTSDLYLYGKTNINRKQALQKAAQSFVNNVQANADKTGADHKIAIVGFGSGEMNDWENPNYQNTEILTTNSLEGTSGKRYDKLGTNDYKEALVSCQSGLVNDAINALDAGGATRVDLGLDMAESIFANNPVENDTDGIPKRNRVVVVLSDGKPTGFSEWDQGVANEAVEHSYTMKSTYNATVYSIGIFPNANASETNPSGDTNENHFMQALSSNYLKARGYDNGNNWYNNKGERNPDLNGKSYYLSATDSKGLDDVFEQISNEVGGAELTELGATTVVQDVISPYFELSGSTNNIKVYTADCTEVDGDEQSGYSYTFGEKQELVDANVEYSDNVIHVSNFDFSANYVGTENNQPRGKKLIIQVPIQYKNQSSFGGNNIPTNDATSGIYNSTGENCYGNFEQPAVNHPVDYKIKSNDQTIYFTDSADLSSLLAYEEGYKADGKRNNFVNIEYVLKHENQIVGTLSIPAGTNADTATWVWTGGKQNPVLEECTQYILECKVSPIEEHKETSKGQPVPKKGVEITPSEEPKVHVLFPEVGCSDTTVFLGESTELTGNVESKVNWKEKNENDTEIPGVSGTEPELTIESEYVFGTQPGEEVYYPEEDSGFKLKVLKGDKDITSQTTIVSEESECTDCYKPENENASEHDFTVHVVAGQIDIAKEIVNKGNAAIEGDPIFTFKIVYTPSENSPYQAKTFYRTIRFSGNETEKEAELLKGLPKGIYEVTEMTTQKYEFQEAVTEKSNCQTQADGKSVTFHMGKKQTGADSTEAVLGKVRYINKKVGPNTNTDTDTVVNRFEYKDGKWTISRIVEPGKNQKEAAEE